MTRVVFREKSKTSVGFISNYIMGNPAVYMYPTGTYLKIKQMTRWSSTILEHLLIRTLFTAGFGQSTICSSNRSGCLNSEPSSYILTLAMYARE